MNRRDSLVTGAVLLICAALPKAEALMRACRQRRITLLLDLDDALFALPLDPPERQR